jgi:ribosomal protein S18 acetylase RimI-like enzyme
MTKVVALKRTIDSIIIRPGTEADAAAFRELRLEALLSHPEAFGSDFETNNEFPLSHWADRLRGLGNETMIYFAEHDGHLIGICGIYRGHMKKIRHSATIFSVYVQPHWRGQHIAERLIEQCLQWARQQNILIVKLAVVTNNTSAIRCYARCGFTVYGIEPHVINDDGTLYDELLMMRKIEVE